MTSLERVHEKEIIYLFVYLGHLKTSPIVFVSIQSLTHTQNNKIKTCPVSLVGGRTMVVPHNALHPAL